MDTTAVNDIISKLDYDWFKKKNDFFLKEGLYNDSLKKIHAIITQTESLNIDEGNSEEFEKGIEVDIDLKQYCWNSFFYGSSAEQTLTSDEEYWFAQFPFDAGDAADAVINFIDEYTKNFTAPLAFDKVITNVKEAVKKTIEDLQSSINDDMYKQILTYIRQNIDDEISEEYNHIKLQIDLIDSSATDRRHLNEATCSKIANFKLGSKKFITLIKGELNEGAALFNLLNPQSIKIPGVKISVEEWTNQDVYYLISRLPEIFDNKFSIASIERKRVLHLKTNRPFERRLFDSFKSQKAKDYASHPNKTSIDNQFRTL